MAVVRDPIVRGREWSVSAGHHHVGYARTLKEAKVLGEKVAHQSAWKRKWNSMYEFVTIRKQVFYMGFVTYMSMTVPVRGSGVHYDRIIARIKKDGYTPFKWKLEINSTSSQSFLRRHGIIGGKGCH